MDKNPNSIQNTAQYFSNNIWSAPGAQKTWDFNFKTHVPKLPNRRYQRGTLYSFELVCIAVRSQITNTQVLQVPFDQLSYNYYISEGNIVILLRYIHLTAIVNGYFTN